MLLISCDQESKKRRALMQYCDSLVVLFDCAYSNWDLYKLKIIHSKLRESCDTCVDLSSINDRFKIVLDSTRALDDRIAKIKPRLRSKYNEFDQIAWIKHETSPKFVNKNGIYLYFGLKDKKPTILRFRIQYYADEWVFIDSYDFSIDGQVYTYYPIEVERDNDNTIWEWLDEPVNQESFKIIKAIINSKSAKVRFKGSQRFDSRVISQAEKNAMADIIDFYRYVHGDMDFDEHLFRFFGEH
jgi:hypothetical protein